MKSAARACLVALLSLVASLSAIAYEWASLPRIDRCRVVFTFEPETRLFQAEDGSVCINAEPQVLNEHCSERYANRALPMPHRRLRKITEGEGRLESYNPLMGIDPQGRPWFLSSSSKDGITVSRVEHGRLESQPLGGGYNRHDRELVIPTRWPWVGRDMLGDKDGIWVAGLDAIHHLSGDEVKSIPITVPVGATHEEKHDLLGQGQPYWMHHTYALAGHRWLVRSFYSNCRVPGSFVIRFTGDTATVVARLHREIVTGLVCHEGEVFMLTATQTFDTERSESVYRPSRIVPLELADPPVGLATRGTAKGGTRAELPDDASLMGMRAAKLVFTDRRGRQYVQACEEGMPTAELVIFDGTNARKATLPSREFVFGCQGDDGRIYGHDSSAIYAIDVENAVSTITPIASMGDLAADDLKVVAACRGLLCLEIQTRLQYRRQPAPVWIDPQGKPADPMLPGRMIAEGLPRQGNDSDYHPIAAGTDATLWFVRYKKEPRVGRRPLDARHDVTTQLLRARAGKVDSLGDPLATSFNPTVWPIAPDTAIVATSSGNDGISGVLFYDQGEMHPAASLAELLENHHPRLSEVMDDGAAFLAGDGYGRSQLLRLGDSFLIEETLFKRIGGGAGSLQSAGIFRDGAWQERVEEELGGRGPGRYRPLIEQLVAIDPQTHRLLAFIDEYKTLAWIPLEKAGGEEERLEVRDEAWAWRWLDKTSLPRFDGCWILTPRSVRHALEMEQVRLAEAKARGSTMPEYDMEMRADDLRNFLRWDGGRWRKSGFSLMGGEVFRDKTGGLWHFRTREAEVGFSDGRSQLVPLDAGTPGLYRLTHESEDAVWVASQESLTRFVRERDAGGITAWKLDRRRRLPRFGIAFAGPWIRGDDFYWVSDGRLYYAALRAILDDGRLPLSKPSL